MQIACVSAVLLKTEMIAHNVSGNVQVIDLGDDMEFSKLPADATADKLVCSDPTIPHDDRNLVIKVWTAPHLVNVSKSQSQQLIVLMKLKLGCLQAHAALWSCGMQACLP
jgi:4-diphosphocytidyl-2C-methyl-D-erythritol kinase